MPRDLPLSNGSLLVTFDREYQVRDIYYPHVGQENHANGQPFRLGVWVDGQFSWMNKEWGPELRYGADSMVTDVRARHPGLGVALEFTDAVDFYENIFVRHIIVRNEADRPREIRVFFHHDFRIRESDVGDTALYSPEVDALLHYKDDRYFLISCSANGTTGVRHYACGQKGTEGKEGTWRDAEDGVLSGNPIAQGSVDSVLGVYLQVSAHGAGELDYWMVAGKDFREVGVGNDVIKDKSPQELLRRTRHFWKLWVGKDRRGQGDLSPVLVERYRQSLLIIRSQIDNQGAVIAANDTDIINFARDTYSYMWPRDGALVSVALLRAGHGAAAQKFLEFCARIISPNGYVRHKYNPDGSLASSWHGYVRDGKPVLPIQEDETALLVWALWQFFELYQRIEETAPFYRPLVTRPADFMLSFVDSTTGLPLSSYDVWEERWGVHAFTVAAVIAALRAAGRIADAFGEMERARRYRSGAERMLEGLHTVLWNDREQRFARMAVPGPHGYTLDMTIDSSLFGLVEFGALAPGDPHAVSTLKQVEDRLTVRTDVGGLARYENDSYHQVERVDTQKVPGNPWFLSTLWLARYRMLAAETPEALDKGRELLDWAAARALASGVMAEQLHPYTGEPLSVSPLTWSHAAYVRAVAEYSERSRRFGVCPTCKQPVRHSARLTDQLQAMPNA